MEKTKINDLKQTADNLLECHSLLIDAIENEKSPSLTLLSVIKIADQINYHTDNRLEIIVRKRDM